MREELLVPLIGKNHVVAAPHNMRVLYLTVDCSHFCFIAASIERVIGRRTLGWHVRSRARTRCTPANINFSCGRAKVSRGSGKPKKVIGSVLLSNKSWPFGEPTLGLPLMRPNWQKSCSVTGMGLWTWFCSQKPWNHLISFW